MPIEFLGILNEFVYFLGSHVVPSSFEFIVFNEQNSRADEWRCRTFKIYLEVQDES